MLFLLFWFDDLPNQCCKSTAYERTNDEYPELRKSLTTLEESRTDGTGWVNGCSGVVDTYEVNQDEGKTDSETGKVVGGTVGLGSRTQYNEYENEGEHNLCQQAVHHILRGAGIGTSCCAASQTRVGGNKECQQCCCNDSRTHQV